jgi:hypothetical protein
MKFGGIPLGLFGPSKLLDLIRFGRGGGTDATKYLKSDGLGKFVLAALPTRAAFFQVKVAGNTSYSPSANVKFIWIRGIGGGGGGAGALGGVSQCSIGGSGGGGGYFERIIYNLGVGPFTIAVGTGGTGGAVTPTNGGNGGDTTFNDGSTTYTAQGGRGGTTMAAGTSVAGTTDGAGGTATNGDINLTGRSCGNSGLRSSGTTGYKGIGGNAPLGWGYGTNRQLINYNLGVAGEAQGQAGFGGGGQGAQSFTAVGQVGSAGLSGLLVIMEFT